MKLSADTLRQVIRLLEAPGMSFRAIGRTCAISPNTAKAVSRLLQNQQLTWSSVQSLDDDSLRAALFGDERQASRKPIPDWLQVHTEMQARDMTQQLLWEEYRQQNPEGLSYTQYTRLYRAWRRSCKLSLRQSHPPGEKLFVDFCGRTMPIRDASTGEITFSQIFVGALGASGYLFITAVASQKIEDWLKAHERMLAHLGGVPRYVVPDNLKAGVLKHDRQALVLNPAYMEFAEHYDFIVLPARPRKPKDKSMAEIGVQIVQRWILARLRHQVFFSLDELNAALSYWMEKLDERTTRTYPVSRMQRFLELDAPVLRPLNHHPYPYSQWRYHIRVDESYHVEHERHLYSVPYTFAHRHVDIRASADQIHIYHQRRLIAAHPRATQPGRTTRDEHLPPHHLMQRDGSPDSLLAWAKSLGPATFAFLEQSFEEKRHFASRLKAAQALRRDARREGWQERLEMACAYALSLHCLSFDRLRSIIRTRADVRTERQSATPVQHHGNLRGAGYYGEQHAQEVQA